MKFRPCIDIHNGCVKQIVGGSLRDDNDLAKENFVAKMDAAAFAGLYKKMGLTGGHVIMLNAVSSDYYEATRSQALAALRAWPGGLQIGGGITDENAALFLDAGASHVIVTSYIFSGGIINADHLQKIERAVGKERLVLDLSCKRSGDDYYIVTDRWQKMTDARLSADLLEELSSHCDEFLVHGVDVEGKCRGIEETLVTLLAQMKGFPITYAGGISSLEDIRSLKKLGNERIDYTVGSALSLFGGKLELEEILAV